MVPEAGYTVSEFAPSFATTLTAPASAGGRRTPVLAAVVLTTLLTADSASAVAESVPAAVRPVATSPQIAVAVEPG
jgi:hypothetical protein